MLLCVYYKQLICKACYTSTIVTLHIHNDSVCSVKHIKWVFVDNLDIFSYFSIKVYVVSAHSNFLSKVILASTHNMFFWRPVENYSFIVRATS